MTVEKENVRRPEPGGGGGKRRVESVPAAGGPFGGAGELSVLAAAHFFPPRLTRRRHNRILLVNSWEGLRGTLKHVYPWNHNRNDRRLSSPYYMSDTTLMFSQINSREVSARTFPKVQKTPRRLTHHPLRARHGLLA